MGADGPPPETVYYSTAAPPVDFRGPEPAPLALIVSREPNSVPRLVPPSAEPPRSIAVPAEETKPSGPTVAKPKVEAGLDPIAQAKRTIAEAQVRFAQVQDYTCRFYKRERIDGRLGSQHVMLMKARTKPLGVYFKFVKPNAGREAIYVAGRNGGKAVVHDVGLGKLIAGTLALDPLGSRAMEDCRHPITEAGIGHLIETLAERWGAEMQSGETHVTVQPGVMVGDRACTLIDSTHPKRAPGYMFHKVRVYFDQEHGLPIRFEAYAWPRRPGAQPELLEEYTYANLKLNAGLREADFDPANKQYSFGRF
jgi:hypothetical protein